MASLVLILGNIEQTRGYQKTINSFGEQSQNAVSVGAGIDEKQLALLNLGVWAQGINAVVLSISYGDVMSYQKVLLKINEIDPIQSNQKILISLRNPIMVFPRG